MTVSDERILCAMLAAQHFNSRDPDVELEHKVNGEVTVSVEEPDPIRVADVAPFIRCSRETIRRRLCEFEERGIVKEVDEELGREKRYRPHFTARDIELLFEEQ